VHCDICILSDEPAFARMLYLELCDGGRTVTVCSRYEDIPTADVYLVDADRFAEHPRTGRLLLYGRTLEDDGCSKLRRPFLITDLRKLTEGETVHRGLRLLPESEEVMLDGEHIRLTHMEYALLACLSAANGRPVPREKIHAEVFEGQGNGGIVNVYIHYLRRKLERGGRRLITALRGQGYALREEETP